MGMAYVSLVISVIATLFAGVAAYAQGGPGIVWRGSGGWGPGAQYNRMFDPTEFSRKLRGI